ncbi:MAG: hypothetical protein JXQ75_03155 [Phycisphaerae bacterium]|nr:hypothetical protein [Phycisphaerae bacterium]
MTITDIAESLKTVLGEATLSLPVTVERAYLPRIEAKNLEGIRVLVVPHGVETEALTRASEKNTYAIHVGVHARVDSKDLAAMDAILALVEEIRSYLRQTPLPLPGVLWENSELEAVYAPKHLAEQGILVSLIRVHYVAAGG